MPEVPVAGACQRRASIVRRVPFADTLNCGDGDDVVYARDTVGVDCEHSIPALKQVIAFL